MPAEPPLHSDDWGLEPLGPDSPVSKQIEKNGGRGGLAHVALRVADIGKAYDYMKQHGFKLIDAALLAVRHDSASGQAFNVSGVRPDTSV